MKKYKLLYNNPVYYSFVSGILISLSINVFYGIFGISSLPSNWLCLLLIALLEFISSILFINLTVILERRISNCKLEIAVNDSNDSMEVVYLRLFPKSYWKLQVKLLIGIFLAVLGLIIMVIPHINLKI